MWGDQDLLDAPEGVLAYSRRDGEERWIVLVNFTDCIVGVDDLGDGEEHDAAPPVVEVASDRSGEEKPFSGRLLPDQALVLRAGSSGRGGSGSVRAVSGTGSPGTHVSI
jgi:hypothetical protein